MSKRLAKIGLGAVFVLCLGGYFYSGIGANIKVECGVNALGEGNCSFTNTGWSPSTICVTVDVVNESAERASSGTVCSGRVWPNDTINRDIVVAMPYGHCHVPLGAQPKKVCSVEVLTDEQRKYHQKLAKEMSDSMSPVADELFMEVLQDCMNKIKLNPNDAEAYSDCGNVKHMLNDKKGACLDWKKADELGDDGISRRLIHENCHD